MADRKSYVHVSTGAPLSRHLKSDADRVREMAADLLAGGMTIGQIATRLKLLGQRLDQRSIAAVAIEDVCERGMEERRSHG